LIANDSIFSELTELGVQVPATIAASSFRGSATRDEKLSFCINRVGIAEYDMTNAGIGAISPARWLIG
jgi:hypothetical protein